MAPRWPSRIRLRFCLVCLRPRAAGVHGSGCWWRRVPHISPGALSRRHGGRPRDSGRLALCAVLPITACRLRGVALVRAAAASRWSGQTSSQSSQTSSQSRRTDGRGRPRWSSLSSAIRQPTNPVAVVVAAHLGPVRGPVAHIHAPLVASMSERAAETPGIPNAGNGSCHTPLPSVICWRIVDRGDRGLVGVEE
jgi:hypothetical protein